MQIGGTSYVGCVAKSKRVAEIKGAFVAFQAIRGQVGVPHFQLQLQGESSMSHKLKWPSKECKDIMPELKRLTNSFPPCNNFLVGNNLEHAENSCKMSIWIVHVQLKRALEI